ncbi:MAG: YetF domain-containing protein [Alphaproteobacteria bacterium]
MSEPIFFNSWPGLLRIVIVGIAAYPILILMLRISGKRTLSKMNAFDFVVTVALGSTLATLILNANVPLLEGLLGLALLVFLQFAISWLSVRSNRFQNLVKSEPTLLVHESRYLDAALRQQRVTREEIGAALRQSGKNDVSEVQSVVLETDGSITVIPRDRVQ